MITKSSHAQNKNVRSRGFTIVEVLVVIVAIAILASITIVAYGSVKQQSRVASLRSDLEGASSVLEAEGMNKGNYPSNIGASNLKASGGTTFSYSVSTDSAFYCLAATNNSTTYRTTSANNKPVAGDCAGIVPAVAGCPTGFIEVPGSATYGTSRFCVMKYLASNSGGVAVSTPGTMPWLEIDQPTAVVAASAACTSCHLLTEAERMTLAQDVLSVDSNWSNGTVGSGFIYSGHNDNTPSVALAANSSDANGYSGTGNSWPSNQLRTLTLTNGEVIWDLAGNIWQWTSYKTNSGLPGSAGFYWREWNALANNGALPVNPAPAYANPNGYEFNSSHGIGKIYSDSNNTNMTGFLHGGSFANGNGAGVFALALNEWPQAADTDKGFRAAKPY